MNQFQPVIFRLSCEEEKTQYQLLLDKHPEIEIVDRIDDQLNELIKIQNPKVHFNHEELSEQRIQTYGSDLHEYGVWVYYPWLRSSVHLLNEKEFVQVRSNRNLYKIKPEEHAVLSTKKVGLIGLSVGHAVALTMAQERCFGELRIADFDQIDLSNLNRIRTPVKNIGLPKTWVVAREIAEIDPFLKVKAFEQGITQENLEDFLGKDEKLDLLIDECDGLDIKIKCREMAKSKGIPVIMETSDRGMMDIERFDLEPKRPIFHGLIPDIQSDDLKDLSNEEKIPYIFPMIELEKSSLRLRASMFEIEQSISTWPQLASDVNLGGATATYVARKILLKQLQFSGRFFVDLADIFKQKTEEKLAQEVQPTLPAIDEDICRTIEEIHLRNRLFDKNLSQEELNTLIKAANAAPSGGNNQPWTWHYYKNKIYLILKKYQLNSLLDHTFSGSMIAFGAAVKNMKLKAKELNLEMCQEMIDFQCSSFSIHSVYSFAPLTASYSLKNEHLVRQIEKRHTSRINSNKWEMPFTFLQELEALQKREAFCRLHLIKAKEQKQLIGQIIRQCDKIRIMHERGHRELIEELRWTEKENIESQDGIDLETLYLSPSEEAGLKISKNWDVIQFLKEMKKGNGFLKLSEKAIDSAGSIGLISIPQESAFQFFNAGKFLQEFWLLATEYSISLQPLTASIFMMKRARHKEDAEFSENEKRALLREYDHLRASFSLKENEFPAFLFRLCLHEKQVKKSLRKPIKHSLI